MEFALNILRAVDTENLIRLVQTINLSSEGDTVAIVRVPSEHSDLLTHALDAGKCRSVKKQGVSLFS